jgi:hypothetical protein
MRRSIFTLCSALPCAGAVRVQDATLPGLITDPNGTLLPEASVDLVSPATRVTLHAPPNDEGVYTLPHVKPGVYDVRIQEADFKTLDQTGIKLDVAQNARMDFALEVGSTTQNVGISLSFNIVSGRCCGGTRVTPEHALHCMTWSRTIVCGPTSLSRELPQPPTTVGYFKEVAALAFSVSKFTPLAMDKARGTFTASATSAPSSEFLALEFPEPFAAAALYIAPNNFCTAKNAQLQISPDGEKCSTLLQFELQAGTPKTIHLGDVQAGWQTLTKMASPGAQRRENDIMNTEALDTQLAETTVELASDIGPLTGETLKYLYIESWECGDPNWTTHMLVESAGKLSSQHNPKRISSEVKSTIGAEVFS